MTGARRASFIQLSDFERLDAWCRLVATAFPDEGWPYLVGSAMTRPTFRDVDIRMMLTDADFDTRFTDVTQLRMYNRAFSAWGQRDTGLPIDFQIQRTSDANALFPSRRNPMGVRDLEGWPMPQGVSFEPLPRNPDDPSDEGPA
jgi:hypothetical protein